MTSELISLLTQLQRPLGSPWDADDVLTLAGVDIRAITGRSFGLLQSDYVLILGRWFSQSILTPELDQMSETHRTVVIMRRAKIMIKALNVELNDREVESASSILARGALDTLSQLSPAKRQPVSLSLRYRLVDAYRGEVFCWLCGYRFVGEAVENFLRGTPYHSPVQFLVDFVYPRGSKDRDVSIVVDHVSPLARGGVDTFENMRLACSFCNSSKSDAITLYEGRREMRSFHHPNLGYVYLPSRSWIVRLFALSGSCAKCEKRASEGQLFVGHVSGAWGMNPVSMRVFCEDHEGLGPDRFVDSGTGLAARG